jgi:hypothetical protein
LRRVNVRWCSHTACERALCHLRRRLLVLGGGGGGLGRPVRCCASAAASRLRRRQWWQRRRRSHPVCAPLVYCRVSFSVSRDHLPGLSVSRACMAFAVFGAKHAVPLFRFRLRVKPNAKFCAGTWDRTLERAHMVCAIRASMFLGVVLFAK